MGQAPPHRIVDGHAGDLALAALTSVGADVLFTLNGGHVWPIYDSARRCGVPIVDTRHEQTATWAAEAYAKLTRRLGVAVLTAGPGVTNGVSAITSAYFNGSPVMVIGGRAPQGRWGSGSLQEIDHVPIVAPITKRAGTIGAASETAKVLQEFAVDALSPHRGPVFADIPIDVFFSSAGGPVNVDDPVSPSPAVPDPEALAEMAAMIATAARPALMVGSDVYWAGAWEAL